MKRSVNPSVVNVIIEISLLNMFVADPHTADNTE